MRFEFAVAFKYLIPRWRHLSVSLISLISVIVISLVVWLVVVFLSVTHGMETKWTRELVSLNAPLKITPTEAYYRSYYHLIDQYSGKANYTIRTLEEHRDSAHANPYDPEEDGELPPDFPVIEVDAEGQPKDLVKELWRSLDALGPKVRAVNYEVSFANLRLHLQDSHHDAFVNQVSYVAPFDAANPHLCALILPPVNSDFNKILCATSLGEGVLVAKQFQKNGVQMGDTGFLGYMAAAAQTQQEQRIPVYVAGFYDPGMMPLGSKLVFADPQTVRALRSGVSIADPLLGAGIQVWFDSWNEALRYKNALTQALKERGIADYWKVETYKEYELTRPLLQQLESDKTLFTLIALIILLVACSNIISMLILLVNDKKREIGILQAMGASRRSIASIFGLCGLCMGLVSTLVGTVVALFTLHHLQTLVDFLSFLQGHEAFQAAFYGTHLPNQVSWNALLFVALATLVISLLAGLIPAWKATQVKPSEILRAE